MSSAERALKNYQRHEAANQDNIINHEAERFICEGIRKEQVSVKLFPKDMPMLKRQALLFDIQGSVGKALRDRGLSDDQILAHPLHEAVRDLLEQYLKVDTISP